MLKHALHPAIYYIGLAPEGLKGLKVLGAKRIAKSQLWWRAIKKTPNL